MTELRRSTSPLLRDGVERTELVLHTDEQTVELDRKYFGRQLRCIIRKVFDFAAQCEVRTHVADRSVGIDDIGMNRLDLIAPDIGLERRDRSCERIADAPEPYGVERYV